MLRLSREAVREFHKRSKSDLLCSEPTSPAIFSLTEHFQSVRRIRSVGSCTIAEQFPSMACPASFSGNTKSPGADDQRDKIEGLVTGGLPCHCLIESLRCDVAATRTQKQNQSFLKGRCNILSTRYFEFPNAPPAPALLDMCWRGTCQMLTLPE